MASKKKQQGGIRKSDGIHFINARPTSESERKQAQRQVRAHVGRWISDQTKDKHPATDAAFTSNSQASVPASLSPAPSTGAASASGASSSKRASIASIAPRPAVDLPISDSSPSSSSFTVVSRPSPHSDRFAPVLHRISPTNSTSNLRSRTPQKWRRSPFPPSNASDSSDSSDDAQSPATEPGALIPWYAVNRLEPQVSSGFDPFCTYPTGLPVDVVDPCETYLTTVLWPGLLPRSCQGKRAVEAWFPLSLSDPALFTAFVYGALCHQRVQCLTQADPRSTFSEKQEKALQNVEMKAIELINKAMQDPSRRLSDAVVLSIVCMAHHNPMDATTREQRPTPFKAPLKDLQWLNIYGCLPPNMIHIHGLIQLLSMRGGLKDIKTYGLAATLSFSDIFTASVLCIKPGFEFWPVDEARRGVGLRNLLGFNQSDIDNAFGRLRGIGITPQMAEAFHAARVYIEIVRIGLATTYDASLLTDQRNLTQYTIFSIPPATIIANDLPHQAHVTNYEACRLACWIFAIGVIFPIPPQSTPLGTLSQQLQGVLQQKDSLLFWSSPHTRIPLLWVLILGGVAATDMPTRRFFLSGFGRTLRRTGITTWMGIKRVLEKMIWYDVACDESAKAFFDEANALFPLKELKTTP